MTFIGQQPSTTFDSGIQDRFTGLSTNTVTLTHEISTEEDILVVWNNIVQDKNTYSVGGTGNKTVTLGGTLVSADVVTVYYLNKVMQSVNPTAGSVNTTQLADLGVTGAKLNTDVISAQTALGATPADTDELLVSDAGVLKRVDYSYLKSVIGTNLFEATMSSSQTSVSGSTWTKAAFNQESYDADGVFDTSNNRFIAPAAGKYFFTAKLGIFPNTANGNKGQTKYYKNGSAIAYTVGANLGLAGSETIIGELYLTSSVILDLAQNDYIEYYGRFIPASGVVTFDSAASFFQGYRVA